MISIVIPNLHSPLIGQVIQALDQMERGALDLEAVQRLIGGSTTA